MPDKKCPRCGLWSTGSALRCDCGYNFEEGTAGESYDISAKPRGGILLAIITGIYTLALIPACFFAIFSGFAFDGGNTPDVWAIFLVMFSFPITISGSIASAWILYRRGRFRIALLVTLLPIAHFAGSYFVPGIWYAR